MSGSCFSFEELRTGWVGSFLVVMESDRRMDTIWFLIFEKHHNMSFDLYSEEGKTWHVSMNYKPSPFLIHSFIYIILLRSKKFNIDRYVR
jgi:hypothetical protein